ncbi:hypothetical protein J2W40_001734 [Sphingobium xenophagum]|uniref:NACHT domain-containing protein n=1 Tax=Sphingobium xenophagum TaxID=121428 RepID=A0ABU1X009_SPHXE|nr:NACHT domain-containing protein [Sphingobium xenophagum]MDR7154916.1 hypothetical protein [Sphingobium xenophagum]
MSEEQLPLRGVALPLSRKLTISVDWKNFATEAAEAVASFFIKSSADAGVSGFSALVKAFNSVAVAQTPSEKAWSLTALSFAWAVGNLTDKANLDPEQFKRIIINCYEIAKQEVDNGEYYLPDSFVNYPNTIPIYKVMLDFVVKCALESQVNMKDTELVFRHKMDISFNRAVFEIWSRSPAEYKSILEYFNSPGAKSVELDLNWKAYRARLVHSFDVIPVFGQENDANSLASLYIPLRATWIEEEDSHILRVADGIDIRSSSKIDLLDNLLSTWVESSGDNDALRLVGGGPGSGKSTTLKALARKYAQREDWRPLFIPLQHIGIDSDLRESINQHFTQKTDGAFTQPPLARPAIENGPPLLLIFDGLDELVAPKETANDVINTFAARLSSLIAALKGDGSRQIRVVISGRMPAFQAAGKFLAPPKIGRLEVFGYLPINNPELVGQNSLWSIDQRSEWWSKYSTANSLSSTMPPALEAESLAGITHEPLLCYLLVLAGYATKDWEKAADNPNRIYAALMKNIYDRGWGDGVPKRHGPGRTMSLADFLLLMETIGHAAWLGGDTRVATEDSFVSTSKITRAETAWKLFIDDNGSDVTNLAMNFYLKAAEGYYRGFEFTHKSFGEYLTARSLIAVAESIHDLAERRVELAMIEWAKATSTGQMTSEILTFMRNEVRLRCSESADSIGKIKDLKDAFVVIAKESIDNGFPIENAASWRSQEIRHNNCEISTWSILNSSALSIAEFLSKKDAIIDVGWKSSFDLRNIIMKLSATANMNIFSSCLSYIKAEKAFLYGIPFFSGDFRAIIYFT